MTDESEDLSTGQPQSSSDGTGKDTDRGRNIDEGFSKDEAGKRKKPEKANTVAGYQKIRPCTLQWEIWQGSGGGCRQSYGLIRKKRYNPVLI